MARRIEGWVFWLLLLGLGWGKFIALELQHPNTETPTKQTVSLLIFSFENLREEGRVLKGLEELHAFISFDLEESIGLNWRYREEPPFSVEGKTDMKWDFFDLKELTDSEVPSRVNFSNAVLRFEYRGLTYALETVKSALKFDDPREQFAKSPTFAVLYPVSLFRAEDAIIAGEEKLSIGEFYIHSNQLDRFLALSERYEPVKNLRARRRVFVIKYETREDAKSTKAAAKGQKRESRAVLFELLDGKKSRKLVNAEGDSSLGPDPSSSAHAQVFVEVNGLVLLAKKGVSEPFEVELGCKPSGFELRALKSPEASANRIPVIFYLQIFCYRIYPQYPSRY